MLWLCWDDIQEISSLFLTTAGCSTSYARCASVSVNFTIALKRGGTGAKIVHDLLPA